MRIAYVITRADAVGGASIHVRDMASAMRERGHDVLVLVGGLGPVTKQLDAAGVPFRSLTWQRAIHPAGDARAFAELVRVLREWRPTLVSTHTAKAGWIGRAAAARLGVPAIYTPHGWSIGSRISPVAGVVFTAAERLAAMWTRAIVCVSEYEKRLALRKRVAPAAKLVVVPNGVRDIASGLRARPGCAAVRICSVARFETPKDHATLLHALAALRALDWELHLVGDGPLEGAMRALAESLGIGGRTHFYGYQPDPAPVLAASQLFVLSSRSESFPRSILEAMRAGLPVAASDVGGIGEAVAPGSTGLLVPPGNPAALANALGELIAEPARRVRMGEAARAAYEARFRLETMIDKTESVYTIVLSRDQRER